LGLFRLGKLERAKSALQLCYERARAHRMRTFEVLAASAMSRVHFVAMEEDDARMWHAEAHRAYSRGRKMGSASLHFSNLIEMAIAKRDCAEARHWLDHSKNAFGAISSGRPRLTYLAYTLLVAKT